MKKQIIPAPAVQTGIEIAGFWYIIIKNSEIYPLCEKKQFFAANWR